MLIPYLQNAHVGLCSKFKLLINCECVYLYAHTHPTQQHLVKESEMDRAKETELRIFIILLVASARLDLLTSVW